ncbi:MAG: hypothetical protein JNL83_01380 [Myxococcales bacterium]|nr:hypothetical protein [Myxococcales bacterium]
MADGAAHLVDHVLPPCADVRLDGHESDAQELLLFEKHAARIALHREVWEQVLTKVTGDEHLGEQATVDAGFIGSAEAVRRIGELARTHLKV